MSQTQVQMFDVTRGRRLSLMFCGLLTLCLLPVKFLKNRRKQKFLFLFFLTLFNTAVPAAPPLADRNFFIKIWASQMNYRTVLFAWSLLDCGMTRWQKRGELCLPCVGWTRHSSNVSCRCEGERVRQQTAIPLNALIMALRLTSRPPHRVLTSLDSGSSLPRRLCVRDGVTQRNNRGKTARKKRWWLMGGLCVDNANWFATFHFSLSYAVSKEVSEDNKLS